jgi:hypothetical protein
MKNAWIFAVAITLFCAAATMTPSAPAFAEEPDPDAAVAATSPGGAVSPTDAEPAADAPRWPDQDGDGDGC